MENENEQDVSGDGEDDGLEPVSATTDWEARAKRLEEKAIVQRERTRTLKSSHAKLEAEIAKLKNASQQTDTKPNEDPRLLQKIEKMTLRAAGITASDEVELALKTAKKWGMDLDEIVDDPDFTAKLEKVRATKANTEATSNIRGGGGATGGKDLNYWIQWSKENPGQMPQISDKKLQVQFVRSQMKSGSGGKKFYND